MEKSFHSPDKFYSREKERVRKMSNCRITVSVHHYIITTPLSHFTYGISLHPLFSNSLSFFQKNISGYRLYRLLFLNIISWSFCFLRFLFLGICHFYKYLSLSPYKITFLYFNVYVYYKHLWCHRNVYSFSFIMVVTIIVITCFLLTG